MGRSFSNASITGTLLLAGLALLVAAKAVGGHQRDPQGERRGRSVPPARLRETGLYASGVRPFTPQYPLWTDGARKQRWIYLPPGAAIDASNPDAWQFPVGTKLWKEFAFGGRTETRYMERTAHGWLYATYVWSAGDDDATLAPARGMRTDVEVAPGVRHVIPSEGDCRACHGNGDTPVLGFSALQLSSDRDPNAPHREQPAADALALPELIVSGAVRGLPVTAYAPRIIAPTPTERAARGYLHGNCGGCHRAGGPLAALGMELAHSVAHPGTPALATTIDRASSFTTPDATIRIAPGSPARSVLVARLGTRVLVTQMPPLGTQLVDAVAVELLSRWIVQLDVH